MEWMLLPFRRYFDFTGRSRRMEFWMFQVLQYGVYTVLGGLMLTGLPWSEMGLDTSSANPDPSNPFAGIEGFGMQFWLALALMGVWFLATFIPSLSVTVRRLHDRGMSGWWYAGLLIAGFVPIVNFLTLPGYLVLLVFMFLDGEPGPNKWGENPKEPGTGNAGVFA